MNKKNIKTVYIGWDIGGANTKVSIMEPNFSSSYIYQCHLWESLNLLKELIRNTQKKYKQHFNIINIITMSGEMSDVFSSRHEGVIKILKLFKNSVGESYTFSSKKPFFNKLKKTTKATSMQSMNWLATAMFLETKVTNAIAIDIGSTTTDIIIIKNGKCKNKNFNDFSRLSTSELIYTGVLRTPVYAITNQVTIKKTKYNVIPENFANMSDVYRILSKINPKKNHSETCDHRGKTHKNSLERLSRALGFDYLPQYKDSLKRFSEKLKLIQMDLLTKKILKFKKKYFTKKDSVSLIGIGIGKFLIKEFCDMNNIHYKDFNLFCKDNKSKLFLPSDIAPSYSINILFKSKNERT